jgi:hypothetical protein
VSACWPFCFAADLFVSGAVRAETRPEPTQRVPHLGRMRHASCLTIQPQPWATSNELDTPGLCVASVARGVIVVSVALHLHGTQGLLA